MLRLLILLLFVGASLAGTCKLLFDQNHPGIFWRHLGSKHIILNAGAGQVTWDERIKINGSCPGGFTKYLSYAQIPYEEMMFSCSQPYTHYEIPGQVGINNMENTGSLTCLKGATYYEVSFPYCHDYGLAYGFFVNGLPVVLADVCYNLDKMQPKFLHYVTGVRSSTVESLMLQNSVELNSSAVEAFFDSTSIPDEQNSLTSAISEALSTYSSAVQYNLDTLLPLTSSLGILGPYTYDFNATNTIPWWTSLKFGNWRLVEEAINHASSNESYDVFAGVSDVVLNPSDDKCTLWHHLTYKTDQYERKVPLYVWNYIKSRDQEKNDGLVIVGVNSPFFEEKMHVLCKDICDRVLWLGNLKKLRKMPSLGYVFCCKPKDVMHKLDNFPILLKSSVPVQEDNDKNYTPIPYSPPYNIA